MSAGGAAPLAIIAGAGRLPADAAAAAVSRGEAVAVLPLRAIADADFAAYRREPIDLFDPQGALAKLRRVGAGRVLLAGAVHRPGLSAILGAWRAALRPDDIRDILRGGDDNVLRGVVRFLEGNGFPVVGIDAVAPGLMAPAGLLGGASPTPAQAADIARGIAALTAMGPSDIGQAVAVCEGRILAVEAAEGTDAMLRRVATLRRSGPVGRLMRRGRPVLAEAAGGVLVKAPKPGQDMRVDLPTIGPRTVRGAAAARLAGIAVAAGGVLVVEREETLALARRLGLFVTGVAL